MIPFGDRLAAGAAWLDLPPGRSLWFSNPAQILAARAPGEVAGLLRAAESACAQGLAAVGYVAYEASPAFDPAFAAHPPAGPLAWFALYRRWREFEPEERDFSAPAAGAPLLERSIERGEFDRAIERIRDYIEAGDVYQINYTFREIRALSEAPFELFLRLRAAHPVPYSAFLHDGERQIVSLSPELYLRRQGARVETRPMKGTAPRGLSWREDEAIRRALALDEKNRAENIMIVDLMRNDLGRICRIGSVRCPALFEVARYSTVHQMTGTVAGELRPGAGLSDIFQATFPPGSITGAPKIRATQIIRELESSPRDVYTGAIGVVFPGGDFSFNVAIRTLVCRETPSGTQARLGLGGGVTYDSTASAEWEECLTKGRFLGAEPRRFSLIETLRLDPGRGYSWLMGHLRRLRQSAAYFGIPFDSRRILCALRDAAAGAPGGPVRVRLLLDGHGRPRWERAAQAGGWPAEGARVRVAERRIESGSVWRRHKTTNRALYDEAIAQLPGSGFDETLFLNERGEAAEGAFTNLIVLKEGRWLTPGDDSGALPGVWREAFARRMALRGAAISLSDLLQCEAALIGNSVRGGTAIRELVLPGGSSRVWPDAARNLAARIGAAGVRVGAALNGFPALFI